MASPAPTVLFTTTAATGEQTVVDIDEQCALLAHGNDDALDTVPFAARCIDHRRLRQAFAKQFLQLGDVVGTTATCDSPIAGRAAARHWYRAPRACQHS